jgi:CH-like domain in sperm protein
MCEKSRETKPAMTFATKKADMPTLTTTEQQELKDWIDGLPNCQSAATKWPRMFADGVHLVKIIHSLNPKLIELHNYSPRNGFTQKLANWQTLNRKVLRKLGLNFDETVLKSLAMAENDVINTVLYDVMRKIRTPKDNVICSATDDCKCRFSSIYPVVVFKLVFLLS